MSSRLSSEIHSLFWLNHHHKTTFAWLFHANLLLFTFNICMCVCGIHCNDNDNYLFFYLMKNFKYCSKCVKYNTVFMLYCMRCMCVFVNEQSFSMCILRFARGVGSNGKQFLRIVCVYQQQNEQNICINIKRRMNNAL